MTTQFHPETKPPCTIGCDINYMVSGDHAYCSCHCHPNAPAIPPSRQRGIETRTITCPCGAELIISISEDSKLSNSEQEFNQIDDARWEARDSGIYCVDCKDDAPESHGEFIDRKVDEVMS